MLFNQSVQGGSTSQITETQCLVTLLCFAAVIKARLKACRHETFVRLFCPGSAGFHQPGFRLQGARLFGSTFLRLSRVVSHEVLRSWANKVVRHRLADHQVRVRIKVSFVWAVDRPRVRQTFGVEHPGTVGLNDLSLLVEVQLNREIQLKLPKERSVGALVAIAGQPEISRIMCPTWHVPITGGRHIFSRAVTSNRVAISTHVVGVLCRRRQALACLRLAAFARMCAIAHLCLGLLCFCFCPRQGARFSKRNV